MRAALRRFALDLRPAPSVREALDAVRSEDGAAVVLDDDGIPEARVLEAVGELIRAVPDLKVALLSASRSPVLPADAIRAGACAYLSKDMPLAELRYALERMLKGQLVVDPVVTRTLLGLPSPDALGNGDGGRSLHLTAVERRVLSLVSDGKANKQIAVELGLSPLTIKNHIARIRARFGAADKAQAVALAIRAGLLE
jgi:DNA-binding NarL/FixJ family response regulator